MTMNKSCGKCIYWSANHAEHKKCKDCKELRNNFVPRDMLCPVPSCQSSMIYYKKDAYLCCPDCGTEIWPFNSEKSDSKSIREEFEKQLPCDRSKDISKSMLKVNSKIPSGSKTKGSSKKQLMQKPSATELYKRLAE